MEREEKLIEQHQGRRLNSYSGFQSWGSNENNIQSIHYFSPPCFCCAKHLHWQSFNIRSRDRMLPYPQLIEANSSIIKGITSISYSYKTYSYGIFHIKHNFKWSFLLYLEFKAKRFAFTWPRENIKVLTNTNL